VAARARRALLWDPVGTPGLVPPEVQAAGWEITTVARLEVARQLLDERRDRVALAHLAPPDRWACRALDELITHSAGTEWIALLAPGDGDAPVCGHTIGGLYDYHTLPLAPQRLIDTLGHAYGLSEKRRRALRIEQPAISGMVAASPAMRALQRQIAKAGPVEAPVLITGESGVGKELTALAIHRQSRRRNGPFVPVNCGALPPDLISSELFGHEKGAFTGAHQRKIGRLEAASGGTVFLDEIGELPLEQQVTLLRFLQESAVDRIGGTRHVAVDTRIIAATNRDLEQAVEAGSFREDLYYRLNVLRVEVPPLRERPEDIEPLAFLQFERFAPERAVHVRGFSEQALQCMAVHSWPGNVRELINRVRRAMVMAEGRLITPGDLGLDRRDPRRTGRTLREARTQADIVAIRRALRGSRNNLSLAARDLGVSRVTLYRLMEKYGISVCEPGLRRQIDGPSAGGSGEKEAQCSPGS